MGYVYKIINNKNGKFYIGSTKDIDYRFKSHKYTLKKGVHQNKHLQNSYNKYGKGSFEFVVIFEGSSYEKVEQWFLDSYDWDILYNMNRNTSGGDVLSYHPEKENIVKMISETMKMRHQDPNNPWKDRDVTGSNNPNWKGGVSDKRCHCGNKIGYNIEQCMSCTDKSGENNSFYGKRHTQETKDKISKMNKGRLPPNVKRVKIEGVEYRSRAEAARELGLHLTVVRYRCSISKNKIFKDWEVL